jgi:lipopolysaccharide transport system ATP-binding protein
VRLAFAVAAHLEPEILIVDEVLAVGDVEFQKKCMGKIQDVNKGGRTVLFVSHSMAAVSKLCQQCILLDGGRLKQFGPTDEIIPHYLKGGKQTDGIRVWDEAVKSTFDPRLRIRAVRIKAPDGTFTGHVDISKPVTIEVEYRILETLPKFRFGLRFFTADGTIAFSTSDSISHSYDTKSSAAGLYFTRCIIPGNLLNEGVYSLTISADVAFKQMLFLEEGAISFCVEQTGGLQTRYQEKWPGAVSPLLEWRTEAADNQSADFSSKA